MHLKVNKPYFRQFTSAFIVSLPAMGFGQAICWISINENHLRSIHSPVGPMSSDQISWLGSLPAMGAVCGALFWGPLINSLGRKRAAILANFPYIFSNLILIFCKNYPLMLFARIFCGIGIVGNMLNIPSYLAEISEDSIRSTICSMLILFVNFGSVLTFVTGAFLEYDQINIMSFSLPVAFVVLITFYLPESPTDLLKAGKEGRAKEQLTWLRATSNEEILQMAIYKLKESFINTNDTSKKISFSDFVNNPYLWKSLACGAVIQSSIVMSGVSTLTTYQNSTLQLALHTPNTTYLSIFLSMGLFSAGLICVLIFRKFNRKVFLVGCSAICGTCFLSCALLLYLESKEIISFPWYVIFILFFLFIFFQGLGYSTAVYSIVPELFAVECRNLFASLLLFLHFSLHCLVNKLYPVMVSCIHLYGWLIIFASYNYFVTFFSLFILPETKGRSIQDISNKLNKGKETSEKAVHVTTKYSH